MDRVASVLRRFPALRALLALAPAISLSAFTGPSACKGAPGYRGSEPAVVIKNSEGREWTVKVEVAATARRRREGLMYRWSLPEGTGMLFVFEDAQERSFWMKNTRIPLDIIFIGPDKRIIRIEHKAEPYSEESIPSRGTAKWVLEVNGGEAGQHGVKPGDRAWIFNAGER